MYRGFGIGYAWYAWHFLVSHMPTVYVVGGLILKRLSYSSLPWNLSRCLERFNAPRVRMHAFLAFKFRRRR